MAMPGAGGAKTGLVKPLGGGSLQISSNGKIMGVLGKDHARECLLVGGLEHEFDVPLPSWDDDPI
jgi:hypothetical protein